MVTVGRIFTRPQCFEVCRVIGAEDVYRRVYPLGVGSDHRARVEQLANLCFGFDITLKVYHSTELPDGYERWGWTRETRPVGEVSIEVDHYTVEAA